MSLYVKEVAGGLEIGSRPKWFNEDGSPVSDAVLANDKIFPLVEEIPEVDLRVKHVNQNPDFRWEKRDGKYHVTYTITDKEPTQAIKEAQDGAHRIVDQWRSTEFDKGMSYNFDGQTDFVQIRSEDKIALLGIHLEALSRVSNGDTAKIDFRSQSNKTYALSPEKVLELTTTALEYIETIYKTSWQKKDAVDGVVTAFATNQKTLVQALDEIQALTA